MYTIKPYTKKQAKKLGVEVKPSTRLSKKIDVYKKGEKVASIGAKGMNDYPTYKEKERKGEIPKGTADKKRKLYKLRHQKDRTKKGTPGYFADQLLW